MTNDQFVANNPVEEVKATFFRVFKIWWSLVWRGFLILMVLGGLFLLVSELFENTFYGRFITWMDGPVIKSGFGIIIIALIALGAFALSYLVICFTFKLVIGKRYKDFRLNFTPAAPQVGEKFSGYHCNIL